MKTRKKNRGKRITKHHLWNRKNGGISQKENLLKLSQDKHNLLHILFGNLDLYDIVILLIRVARAKHYERVNPKMRELYHLPETRRRRYVAS